VCVAVLLSRGTQFGGMGVVARLRISGAMAAAQNILVVDDDLMVLRFVTATLKRHGYHVHQATSGDEGLQYFSEHRDKLSMVLTDIVMPGMSGPQMVEHILALHPGMRVTFMTGTAADNRVPQDGTRPMLLKPFTPQKLLDAVQVCLSDT
jgi:two-component system, cell cycle sensor histidine kinase and response regulator CckA